MSCPSETMHAVRYHGPNKPLTFDEIATPTEVPSDHVLIKVTAAALCHTELHFCDGTLNLGVSPMTLGHEGVGVIAKVGSDVSQTRVGQRVICYYYHGCGDCRWCKSGDTNLCVALCAEYGFISDGALGGYMVIPADNAVPLPDTISDICAAPIGCGVKTAVHAAKLARVKKGEWCLIYGVNGVGFGLLQLLKNVYGAKVICVTRSEEKRNKALELGAEAVVDATDASKVASTVLDVVVPEGVDVVFECVGRRETMDASVGWTGALGRRGRLVLIGYTAGDDHNFVCHPMPLIVNEQSVIGSVGATLEDLKEAVDHVAAGKVTTIVDSQMPLKDFQKGLDRIRNCQCVGKVVCIP